MQTPFTRTVVFLCVALASPAAIAQDTPARSLEPVAGDVHLFRNNFHSALVVVTDEGVVVVDPINAEAAGWLEEALGEMTEQPVTHLIYSHSHLDHASGGEVFADTATVIAHANAPETIVTDIDRPAPLFTPLAIAAIRGDTDMVTLPLDAGADPDAIGYDRANALSMAVLSCCANLDLIETLIDAGADIENRSHVGITPLMLAIQQKRTDVALRLIAAGADVDTLGPFGDGVLNYAIYVKEPVLINAALDRGVDTGQLRKLFTTVDYDPPGIGDAQSHHELLCDGS